MDSWSAQRAWLQNARKEIREHLQNTRQYQLGEQMQDELGELSMYDNHPADIGSELFERGKDVGLRDLAKLRLQEVDRALKAMDDGTYGTCQMCGKQIPKARLEAYPLSTMCIDCKRVDEHNHPDRDRPIEEEFLWPGFGRTDTDDQDSVVFDGEDSLQAVWRFNQRDDYNEDYDYYAQDDYIDDNEGLVDDMDRISNDEYRRQLP